MRTMLARFIQWFDTDAGNQNPETLPDRPDLIRIVPFAMLHVGCLGLIWVGVSWVAAIAAILFYFIRMFAVTGFYHRYFSHRTFKTSRVAQFVFALLGSSAIQRGPLWWAAHHRNHHQHSDHEPDVHSPIKHGFVWAHVGWFTSPRNFPTDYKAVKDFAQYPELVFLNRFDMLIPVLLAALTYGFGAALAYWWPASGTSGMQMLVWGFFVSTTVLFHCTASINSFAHLIGFRRFKTTDKSRNSLILALLTLGEGWHNNHHHYMHSARQGFYWWEIDITYYGLKAMSWVGLIWDLRPVPVRIYDEAAQQRRQR
ncbi:MAG: acyl-CoA desaturase [Pedosphaera sp.]|nr:acyl-CoA desaturase [Pedosphaera sp.]